jgi:hypothetical protein
MNGSGKNNGFFNGCKIACPEPKNVHQRPGLDFYGENKIKHDLLEELKSI